MRYLRVSFMALLMMPVCLFTACDSDDDEDEKKPEPTTNPVQPITNNVDAEKNIDDSYSPTISEIQKQWAGSYEGYDTNQEQNTKIKRLLTLLPNNTYINIIQGVLVESGKSDYVDFEHEYGTYSYNSRTKTITYTVQYDSLLDYGTQKFDGYRGKKYYDHTDGNYTEKVAFSTIQNGQRSWISHDTYLQSLTDRTINIAFAMIPDMTREDRK